MPRSLAPLLAVLVFVLACGDGDQLRLGTKPFAEQEILSEIIEAVLEDKGIRTRPALRCEDTYDCHRALSEGRIDVMVEYTGTALHFMGRPPAASEDALAQLQALYDPMGVRWLAPLGFDNGYVWLVPSGVAEGTTMSELAMRKSPVRVACPPEYLRRPRDGLAATADRYGIRLAEPPLVIVDPLQRYQAVSTGRADVAVGYGTDGNPSELGLRPLADDLDFFGPYEAAIVAREDALKATPGLATALGGLQGRIDTATMRELNQAVALQGEAIDTVAARFIHEEGLVAGDGPRTRVAALKVAYASEFISQSVGTRTLAALRATFADQPVTLRQAPDPITATKAGRARFGIVTADAFFERDRRGRLRRRDDAEALAVLGHLTVHVLTRPEAATEPLRGRIGVDTRTYAIGEAVVAGLGLPPPQRAEVDALVRDVTEGTLDAAIVPAFTGDASIRDAVAAGEARLASIADLLDAQQQLEAPWLRPARIPAATYPDQPEPIETVSTQVLLAGPVHNLARPHAVGGPAAAVPLSGPALTLAQLERLVEAIGIPETPDPALPTAAITRRTADSNGAPWLDAVLNAVVIAFLAWLFVVVIAPSRPADA